MQAVDIFAMLGIIFVLIVLLFFLGPIWTIIVTCGVLLLVAHNS